MRILGTAGLIVCLATAAAQAQSSPSYGFATYNAFIGTSGDVLKSSGVQSASRQQRGIYSLTFTRSVEECVYAASLAGSEPGSITIANQSGAPNVVTVYVFNRAGSPDNRRFSVIVSCAS